MELVFDYKIKGWLKRFVEVIYSIIEFRRKVFVLSVQVLSPYKSKWVNKSSFMDRRLGLRIFQHFAGGLALILEIRAVEKVVLSCSIALP